MTLTSPTILDVPSSPRGDLLEQAIDLAEEGVSAAADSVGAIAERASHLGVDDELRSAAGRVTDETEGLLGDLGSGDPADRRAVLALAAFGAVLAVGLLLVARRRRSAAHAAEDDA